MGPELAALVKHPVGAGELDGPSAAAERDNPVCGDKLRLTVRVAHGRLTELAFRATACPATVAVASCAVRVLAGKPLPDGPPFATLRGEVARLGGLSSFEQHALALVESALAACVDAVRGDDSDHPGC